MGETLPPHVQNNSPYIKYVIQLEQSHMEGAYNKILNSSKDCPSQLYVPFAEKLIETVREEICACGEEAYESLTIPEAMKIMRFDSKQALLAYAKESEWVVHHDPGGHEDHEVRLQAGPLGVRKGERVGRPAGQNRLQMRERLGQRRVELDGTDQEHAALREGDRENCVKYT